MSFLSHWKTLAKCEIPRFALLSKNHQRKQTKNKNLKKKKIEALHISKRLFKHCIKNHLCNIYNFILYTTLYFIQLYTLYYFILYTTLYFIQLSLWCPLYKMKLLSFNKFEILVSAFWQVVNWSSNLKPQNSMIWTYIFNMIYIVLHIHRKKCIWLVFSQ